MASDRQTFTVHANAISQTHHHCDIYRRNAQVHRIYDTVSANDMDAFSSIITTPTHIYGHIQTELKHWQRIHAHALT